ncbi:MAG: hypothetical protein VKJ24_12340 [Synechococcales bacterium]|nr:hypothetical protein [Synechococcales bacterium]
MTPSTSELALYTTLQILTPTGRSHPKPITAAEQYLQTHPADPIALLESQDPIALLCLRCFISHQIIINIRSLVRQFGTQHQFKEEDLLPIVLDDDGKLEGDRYKPLSLTILDTFDPSKGSLTNWTIRHLNQHPELKLKLLEHGCYRITPWGFLNKTKPQNLPTMLIHLSDREITQAQALLAAYRTVYLPDRLQAKLRTTCPPPTPEQLARIAIEVEQLSQKRWTPDQIFSQLKALSNQIRQSQINRKSGIRSDRSLDDPNFQLPLESELAPEASDQTHTEFLTQYRTQFSTALTTAIATTIDDRTRTQPKKATQFLTALKAYACDKLSMGDIAPVIGVRGQDTVSRLIKLTALRSDIRCHLLSSLKSVVFQLITPDDLVRSDRAIEAALDEQIEALMQEEAQNDKTPKGHKKSNTRLSIALCAHLDGLLATPANSS